MNVLKLITNNNEILMDSDDYLRVPPVNLNDLPECLLSKYECYAYDKIKIENGFKK